MSYVFQFGDVFAAWPDLLFGAWLTMRLSLSAMALGLAVAIVCAFAKTAGPGWLRLIVDTYVEVIRNTPFLVQIFLVYFGLPVAGFRLNAEQAALLALTVNLGAYATEIVRAGIEAIPKGQTESGLALGLRPMQVYRYVIFFPALKTIFPALSSQFVLLMLTSSVASTISANELTSVANNLQSLTFRSFEVYLVVTAMYLFMSLTIGAGLAAIHRVLFKDR